MNINEVIKYPILSEKTYAQMENGIYAFAVDKRTNKAEVKKVVEKIFEVEVKKVNIINVDKKPAKLGKFKGFKSGYKKAIVQLEKGSINIYPEEIIDDKKSTKKVEQEKVEMSEVEKKVAEKIAKKEKETLADKIINNSEKIVEEIKETTNDVIDKTEEVIKETISKKEEDKKSE